MNGVRTGRCLASPVRLTLTSHIGDDVDGAWWPHTACVARELPELIEALHEPVGEIIDISVMASRTASGHAASLVDINGTAGKRHFSRSARPRWSPSACGSTARCRRSFKRMSQAVGPVWETSQLGPFNQWPTGGGGFEYRGGRVGPDAVDSAQLGCGGGGDGEGATRPRLPMPAKLRNG